MRPEVSLKCRIESDIARIVEKKIELCLISSRACQIVVVQRAAVRRDDRRIRDPMGVLKERRFGRQKTPQGIAVRLSRLTPISSNRVPAVAKAFLVGVAVLGDNRGYTFRVLYSNPQAHGSAVVKD